MDNEARIRDFVERAVATGRYTREEAEAFARQKLQEEAAAQQPQKGLGRTLVEGVVEPFTKYAGYVGEAGAQLGRTAFNPQLWKARLGMEMTPEDIEKINQMRPNILPEEIAGFEFGLTPEEMATRKDLALTGAKRTAAAEAMLLPAGGSLKGAMALGGVAGGLHAFSEDENILGGVAGGALTGGVLHGAGKLARGAVREAREGGEELLRKVLMPSGQKTPRFFNTRQAIMGFARRVGLTGSPTNMLRQVNTLYDQGGEDLTKLVVDTGLIGRPLKAGTLKQQIRNEISANMVMGTGEEKLVENIIKRIVPYSDDVAMNPQRWNNVYKKVTKAPGSRVSKAFNALDKGGVVGQADEAWLAAYDVVSGGFKNKVKGADTILNDMSLLHDVGTGLRQAEFLMGVKVPLTEQKIGGRAMGNIIEGAGRKGQQYGESRIARGVEGLANLAIEPPPAVQGRFLTGQPPSLTQVMQTGARLTGAELFGGGGEMPEAPPALEDVEAEAEKPKVWSGVGTPNVGDTDEDGLYYWNGAGWSFTPEHIELMAVDDVLRTGGKNLGRISNISKAIGAGTENLTGEAAATMAKLNTAEALIKRYSNYLTEEGISTTPATGLPVEQRIRGGMMKIQAALGLEPSGSVKAFGNAREGTMSLLAKSLGEVGTMTDKDIERARKLVPDVTMTPEEIAKNMELLMQIIADAKASLQPTGAGIGGGIELTELGQETPGVQLAV